VALPLETRTVVPWDVLRKIVDDYDPTARVAVGDAVPGLDGFRQTHRQALRAQDVAVFARPPAHVVRGCARATGRRGCSRHWMPAQSRSNSFAPSIPTPVTAASRRALHQHAEVRVVQPRRFGAAVGKGGQRQAKQILVQATPVGEVLGRCRTSHASVLRLHAETLRRSMASAARWERSHGIAEGHPLLLGAHRGVRVRPYLSLNGPFKGEIPELRVAAGRWHSMIMRAC
jgi:hypothetical protein